MSDLNSAQRKHLRTLAHSLEPTVIVGKQGVSDMLVRAVSQALDAHELIKVRFNEFKGDKKALTAEITRRTGASVAGMIGHVAIIYRPHPDPEKRRITLPQRPGMVREGPEKRGAPERRGQHGPTRKNTDERI